MGEARAAPPPTTTLLAPAEREWMVTHNLANNEVALNVLNNDARIRLENIDMVIGRDVKERFSYLNNHYDTVRAEIVHERRFERENWKILTVTRTVLTSTKDEFLIRATLDAYLNDSRVFSKSWDETVTRDFL
jgi:hypothetical protein